MHRFFAAVTVAALLAASGFAQSKKLPAPDASASLKSNPNAASTAKEKPRTATATPRLSSINYEIYTNVSVPAGGYWKVDSHLDFSSCDTIRVTVLSNNNDLTNNTSTQSGLALAAMWSVPESNYWVNGEVIFANESFTFPNGGGALFNTYGNELELQLWNLNTTAMSLPQVMIVGRQY